jgi:hypothetical protein
MEKRGIERRQIVADEYSQEEFSDESINVNSVLTWNVYASGRLKVDFQHEFVFDSTRSNIQPDRVQAAINKLQTGT